MGVTWKIKNMFQDAKPPILHSISERFSQIKATKSQYNLKIEQWKCKSNPQQQILQSLCVWARQQASENTPPYSLRSPRVQRGFSVNSPSWKLGTQFRISVHGPLRPPSLSTPCLGMLLSLPLRLLVQVDRNDYFLYLCPANHPQFSETLAWVRLARVSTLPSCLPSPPQKAHKAWWIFEGILLMKFWRFSAGGLAHPKTSVQKIRAKIRVKIFTKIRTKISVQNPCKKACQTCVRKSVQKFRAKNPCRKSVQKMRAEICANNPCKTNLCKWFPHRNPANWETPNFIIIFVRVVLLQVGFIQKSRARISQQMLLFKPPELDLWTELTNKLCAESVSCMFWFGWIAPIFNVCLFAC